MRATRLDPLVTRSNSGTSGGPFATLPEVLTDVAAVASADGAITAGKHNPVDATAANRAMTLADATAAGQVVAIEKIDSSTHTVTLTCNLRGVVGGTVALVWQREALYLLSDSAGSWWPIAGHKTKASLDLAYVSPAMLCYIDPTKADSRWSGAGMTDAGAGAWDATRAAANTTAFRAALAYAATNKIPVYVPAGTWDLQGQIKFLVAIPIFSGAGVDNTTFRFKTGAGRTQAAIDSGSGSTSGYAVETADGLGTGLMIGNNTGNYAGPGGRVRDFTVISASGNAPNYTAADTTTGPSTAVGLCINGVTQCSVENVRVSTFGVGFDMIGNCGGTQFINCTAPYRENCLGFLFRGVETQSPPQTFAQSGSDITLINCWFHGLYAAICAENGATDLNVYAGQFSAGAASTTATDAVAALVCHRFWCDGTIGADGLPGAVPTPGTGSVGKISFKGADLEGTRLGWALYRSYSTVTILIEDCNVIAYQKNSVGATVTAPYDPTNAGVQGLFKMTGAGNSSVTLRNNTIKGAFVTKNWISVAGQTSGFILTGEDNNGKQNAVFGDYNGLANCTGNWLAVDVVSGNPTNIFRFGGVTVPYRAANGAVHDFNGLLLRNNAGVLQQSTDGATWANVATGTVPVAPVPLRKTGNSTATSSAVLASDADLQFAAVANSVYRVSGVLVYAATQAADIQLAWSVPAGASLSGDMIGLLSSATSSTGQNTFTAQQGTGAKVFGGADAAGPAATKLFIQVDFIFVVGATAGTIALQWAQNSSTADATTLYSNSFLVVEKLS